MIKNILRGSSAVAVLCAQGALAQDDTTDLSEIIVSGGLTGIAAENFTRSYSVVTAEDIRERGIMRVQDALRALPGVSVASSGSTVTGVFIRGGESNHVKVLIDGVEINGALEGNYNFSSMPVANIEKIEVLRGPQSAIYGTSAMSGVISITTKRAQAPGTTYGGGIEVAKDGQYNSNLFVRQGWEKGQLSFSIEQNREDYNYASLGMPNAENKVRNINLSGDTTIGTGRVRIGFNFRDIDQAYTSYPTENATASSTPESYLTTPLQDAEVDEQSGAIWLEAEARDARWLHSFELSGMDQKRVFEPNDLYASTRESFRYTSTFALDGANARNSNQKLNLRLEAQREGMEIDSQYSQGTQERNSRGIAVDYQGSFSNGIDVQAGLRYDDIDVFENPLSWNLSAAYSVPGTDLRLRGAIGQATVNPTMYEQFGYSPGQFIGNPNLKPEESMSYEIGGDLSVAGGRGQLGLTIYRNEIQNMIASVGMSADNLSGTSIRQGIEFTTDWSVNDWLDVKASYSYGDGEDPAGDPLARRPEHEIGLQARATFLNDRAVATADLRYVNGSYDKEWFRPWPNNPITKLPSFTVVNIAAQYALTDTVNLNARITNLFDEEYSEAWGSFGQRRTAYLGLSASF
ncbi:TonB-dependent receptor [Shimia sp. R11_0]|uniref:TonB-dependent receptor n=1 Tax=Shimia sp. R11_0 TaxID=2821096 RepID=UPI001ADAC95D|nr:TonB-dependent receptor [Shimia sp. R11_0]MBO9479665.1 TonB-dependent receptor [Shimia sp. R11_0]